METGVRAVNSAKRALWNDPMMRAIFRAFGPGVTLVAADLPDGTKISGGIAPVDPLSVSNAALLADPSRDSRRILPKPWSMRKRR